MKPFFSIITASYNRAAFLPKLFQYLDRQTFADFELILVDDGSTDDTQQIVAQASPSFKLHYLFQENQGVTAARNKGARFANGGYLIFLDTDDKVVDDWLKNMWEACNVANAPTCVFCGIKRMNEKHQVSEVIQPLEGKQVPELSWFKAGAYAMEINSFNNIGCFDEAVKFGENTELAIRFIQAKLSFAIVPAACFYYYPSVAGGSKNYQNLIHGNRYVLQKHPTYFKQHPQLFINYLQTTAVALYKNGNAEEARLLFLKAWIKKPWLSKSLYRAAVGMIPWIGYRVWRNKLNNA